MCESWVPKQGLDLIVHIKVKLQHKIIFQVKTGHGCSWAWPFLQFFNQAETPPCMAQTARAAFPVSAINSCDWKCTQTNFSFGLCYMFDMETTFLISTFHPWNYLNIPTTLFLKQQPQPWSQQGAYQMWNVTLRQGLRVEGTIHSLGF